MSKLKVLVIDETAFIRDLIKNNLRSHFPGLSVHDVDSGRKAQSLLRMHIIDLVMCDWEMSETSGEELLLWLRGLDDSPNRQVPFIMVSSKVDKDHLVRAIEAGVSEYITKPFNPEQLLSKVSKVLAKMAKLDLARGTPSRLMLSASAGAESLSVLTSSKSRVQPVTHNPIIQQTASAAQAPVKAAAAPVAKPSKATARILISGQNYDCDVKALTLNELKGQIERRAPLPSLFETLIVEVKVKKNSQSASVGAYIHALQAVHPFASSDALLITLRFADPDPDKMELLSKLISSL